MASPAGGSGGRDAQLQLLTLIRGFATEKSQGGEANPPRIPKSDSPPVLPEIFLEAPSRCSDLVHDLLIILDSLRRVSDLKKRLIELQAELEAANAGLEVAKGQKEAAEHGLKGSEVELSMTDASVIALEVFSYPPLPLYTVYCSSSQDDFCFNYRFPVSFFTVTLAGFACRRGLVFFRRSLLWLTTLRLYCQICKAGKTMKDDKPTVEDKLSDTNVQLNALEQKYQVELSKQDESECMMLEPLPQILQRLADVEKRAFFGEAIIEETKQLQELARYPYKKSTPNLATDRLLNQKKCTQLSVQSYRRDLPAPAAKSTTWESRKGLFLLEEGSMNKRTRRMPVLTVNIVPPEMVF
ncbi:hypothetical protein Taro_002214 [Colocasia esculenta]|uniref:Uncharacterized protein n=1 Tax=Colocasia esculenta TaxID=4460 RepID=A0A843TDE8_COLES|nr:hypothetical protein [Colocasia esculenta]